jgi:hypothetical protein
MTPRLTLGGGQINNPGRYLVLNARDDIVGVFFISLLRLFSPLRNP